MGKREHIYEIIAENIRKAVSYTHLKKLKLTVQMHLLLEEKEQYWQRALQLQVLVVKHIQLVGEKEM